MKRVAPLGSSPGASARASGAAWQSMEVTTGGASPPSTCGPSSCRPSWWKPAVRAELLDDSPIFEHVKKTCIEDLIDRPFLPNSQSKFLFYFLNAKMFIEEFGAEDLR